MKPVVHALSKKTEYCAAAVHNHTEICNIIGFLNGEMRASFDKIHSRLAAIENRLTKLESSLTSDAKEKTVANPVKIVSFEDSDSD